MKYAVIKVVNGNFSGDSEWADVQGAIVQWHAVCRALWNEATVETAMVEIVDENLDVMPGYRELIKHTVNS